MQFKFITDYEYGQYEFDMDSYCNYIKSIQNKLSGGIIEFFRHSFHDETIDILVCHVTDDIELFTFNVSYILHAAKIIDCSFSKTATGIYEINESIIIDELLFLPPDKYVWNILFTGTVSNYLSISFMDISPICRKVTSNKNIKLNKKIRFNHYKNLEQTDIGSVTYGDIDLIYQVQLLDNKKLFPQKLLQFFSECDIRLCLIRRIIEYCDGDIEVEFANNVSLVWSGVLNFSVSNLSSESSNIPQSFLNIWNNDGKFLQLYDLNDTLILSNYSCNEFLWLYEELSITNNHTYILTVKTTMFSFVIEFVEFTLYDPQLKLWFNKDGDQSCCYRSDKPRYNLSHLPTNPRRIFC
jgi:hypothetical protein